MVRTLAAVAAVSFVLGAAGAEAQTVRAIAEEPKVEELKGDPDRRVCRVQEVTGSRLQKGKRCRTAREWAEVDLQTRLAVRQLRQPQDERRSPRAGNITLGRPQ